LKNKNLAIKEEKQAKIGTPFEKEDIGKTPYYRLSILDLAI
jgi:hypothetical protein